MKIANTNAILGQVYAQLKEALPTRKFAIAGGAVRDYLMDRSVKDIDVLVEAEELTDEEAIALEDKFGVYFAPTLSYNTDESGRVEHPYGFYISEGMDIILVPNIERYVKDFPDNISKAWFNETGIHMDTEFVEGHNEMMIKYSRDPGDDRDARLRAKYPAYEVRRCE